jgi:hypothetical protein
VLRHCYPYYLAAPFGLSLRWYCLTWQRLALASYAAFRLALTRSLYHHGTDDDEHAVCREPFSLLSPRPTHRQWPALPTMLYSILAHAPRTTDVRLSGERSCAVATLSPLAAPLLALLLQRL